jgi:malate synthase
VLDDGRKITKELLQQILPEELQKVHQLLGEAAWAAGHYEEAAKLFEQLILADDYVEFLTLPGYAWLTRELRDDERTHADMEGAGSEAAV